MTHPVDAGPGSDSLMATARWIGALRWEDLPATARRSAGLHALDAVGVALRASRTAFGSALLDGATGGAAASNGSGLAGAARSRTTVLGGRSASDPRLAALLNGALVHGLEFDDTHVGSVVHGSAVVLPAALASAEDQRSTADLLLAYVAGWEVLVRLGLLAPGAYQRNGFQTAAICGPIGAAATVAKLRAQPPQVIRNAMAIATSLAGGLMAYAADGANVKRLHLGWAAQGGIAACDLSEWGVRGATGALEGRQGFLESFARVPGDFASFSTLGSSWELEAASFKEYPCCHFIHAYVDAALELRRQLDVASADRITCPANPAIIPVVGMLGSDVIDVTGAQYSLALCVAMALRDGAVTVGGLEAAVGTRELVGLASRVEIVPSPAMPFPGSFGGTIVAWDAHGRALGEVRLDRPLAAALGPAAREAMVRDKFMANAGASLSRTEAEWVVECLLEPDQAEVGEWRLLVAGRRATVSR